jgi:hypothetical protein
MSEKISGGIILLSLFALFFLFGPIITYFCYNYLSPTFNLPNISFWQSTVLFILCKILFGGGFSFKNGK